LSDYDFQSEVDVNILGHIFENSLNEIDEIKSEIEGNVIDKTKTKRKKDGVFYTPKYITKYIVDNTVGKLCAEKKEELKLIEEEYHTDKNLQTKTKKALLDKLTSYREWLLQLTICDPACGSGAFLNQALEFLIVEHRYIDELQAKLMGDSLVLSDVETSILENNIYGVDLNDESIEIAKLSLWLRTAQKGRKLNSLNNNIKCGNSLIDDPEIAGDKAFSWEKEFPEVFAKGGFDVIIGNPPYVRQELFKEIKPYLEKNYRCYNSIADLYTYFIEKGIYLINKYGLFSFILVAIYSVILAKISFRLSGMVSNSFVKLSQNVFINGIIFDKLD
jgi:type II restriction/modification system DNA methylase subunit YeeA